MAPPRVLDVHDLSVTYGSFTAVDRVSFHADRGEIIGLLGPNGAGKTSVIRALTTIVPVAGGTAVIDGHDLGNPVGVRRSIGVLPESNGYPGAQSAPRYLRFYGQLFGLDRAEAEDRAERLLAQVGLAGNHNRIATFSRGMRQRLGLARALINDPVVLFLDEPTLGLDPAGQEEILSHLTRAAAEEGTCVILCSHLLDEVERVCDRVAIMHHGRIVAQGTVEEVIARSGIAGYGRIRLAPGDVDDAGAVLGASTASRRLRFDTARPGDLEIELADTNGDRSAVLRLLLDAGIEPRAFDLQGPRLSDAFLALTAAR
jgi:ABC-2 type transport system ATP-binding protein